jgi:hypothetical protein
VILHLLRLDGPTYCGKRGSGRAVLNATTEPQLATCEKCRCSYDTWQRHHDADEPDAGARIVHRLFGEGVIEAAIGPRSGRGYIVAFPDGRRRSISADEVLSVNELTGGRGVNVAGEDGRGR